MTICVSGACGFIGGELISMLNGFGYHDIIAIDYKKKKLRKDLIVKKFIDWEFIYKNKYYDFLNLVDITFHLGANSSTRATKEECEIANIKFTINFITEHNIRAKALVISSSASVYGARRSRNNVFPQSEYAKSKLIIENFIKYFPLNNIVCLRYHNVYGATESHKGNMASIINKWIENHFKKINDNPLFEGSGKILRDFVHVYDVNKVHIMMLDYLKRDGLIPFGTYDVGVGKCVSFNTIAKEIIKHTKGKYHLVPNPYDETNYQFYTKANIEKVKNLYKKIYKRPFSPIEYKDGVSLVYQSLKLKHEK